MHASHVLCPGAPRAVRDAGLRSFVRFVAALFAQTHEALKRHAARSVDAALVARNWPFGAYIEEFERVARPGRRSTVSGPSRPSQIA